MRNGQKVLDSIDHQRIMRNGIIDSDEVNLMIEQAGKILTAAYSNKLGRRNESSKELLNDKHNCDEVQSATKQIEDYLAKIMDWEAWMGYDPKEEASTSSKTPSILKFCQPQALNERAPRPKKKIMEENNEIIIYDIALHPKNRRAILNVHNKLQAVDEIMYMQSMIRKDRPLVAKYLIKLQRNNIIKYNHIFTNGIESNDIRVLIQEARAITTN